MKYLTTEEVCAVWNTHAICIELPDGTDVLAQENGYTLEQCMSMGDAKFFVD